MRIAYLIHWNESPESGVWKKVVGQVLSWVKAGNDVSVFLITRRQELQHSKADSSWLKVLTYSAKSSRLAAWLAAVRAVVAFQPDVVYWRMDIFYPPLVELFRKIPVILEINTNDSVEFCLRKDLRCWYHRITRLLSFGGAKGAVLVAYELRGSLPRWFVGSRPTIVIANGIALENFPELPAPSNPRPRLIFLGSEGQTWQGVDKVLTLAKAFPEWHFDVVGPRPDLFRAPSNVVFHGFLSRDAYVSLMAQADVGVGTLALHRKRANEASPLKTREYLAYGLPVIIGYKDADFPGGAPFLLELPNHEANVSENLSNIERFILSWMGKRVPRHLIVHLDNNLKEQQRLDFIKSIIVQATKR